MVTIVLDYPPSLFHCNLTYSLFEGDIQQDIYLITESRCESTTWVKTVSPEHIYQYLKCYRVRLNASKH
jgi:hypothetical protein